MAIAPLSFERIAIVGLGLIGGSWALALEQSGVRAERVGCDRPSVLKQAKARGAIHRSSPNLAHAVQGADLIILATPVETILQQLRHLKGCAPPRALITDVGSTKERICRTACSRFSANPMFIGGHPLAGRECSGFSNADARLFQGAHYVLSPLSAADLRDPRVVSFKRLIRQVGGRPYVMSAKDHDRAAAFLSHLPQLIATALASSIMEETRARRLSLQVAGSGFRDMTRLAESPYNVWRDICRTNDREIRQAMDKLLVKLSRLRRQLQKPSLEKEFQQALRLRRRLKELRS